MGILKGDLGRVSCGLERGDRVMKRDVRHTGKSAEGRVLSCQEVSKAHILS